MTDVDRGASLSFCHSRREIVGDRFPTFRRLTIPYLDDNAEARREGRRRRKANNDIPRTVVAARVMDLGPICGGPSLQDLDDRILVGRALLGGSGECVLARRFPSDLESQG